MIKSTIKKLTSTAAASQRAVTDSWGVPNNNASAAQRHNSLGMPVGLPPPSHSIFCSLVFDSEPPSPLLHHILFFQRRYLISRISYFHFPQTPLPSIVNPA